MSDESDTRSPQAPPFRRLRLGEFPADPTSGKKVWHSNGAGVDLVTEVDVKGRATFHELTRHECVVTWSRDLGVRTGREQARGRKSGRGEKQLIFDRVASAELINQTLEIVSSVSGDRYLQHLEKVLRGKLGELVTSPRDTVTNMAKVPLAAPPVPEPHGLIERLRRKLGI